MRVVVDVDEIEDEDRVATVRPRHDDSSRSAGLSKLSGSRCSARFGKDFHDSVTEGSMSSGYAALCQQIEQRGRCKPRQRVR